MKGRGRHGYKVNVLCLAGAILALGTSMLAWTDSHLVIERGVPQHERVKLDVIDYAFQTTPADRLSSFVATGGWPNAVFGAQLFLAGIAISFVTTLGGVVLVSGLALFRFGVNDLLGAKEWFHASSDTALGLSFWISLMAGALVIASIFFQLSPDFRKHTTTLADRLLVFTRKAPPAQVRVLKKS